MPLFDGLIFGGGGWLIYGMVLTLKIDGLIDGGAYFRGGGAYIRRFTV